MGESCSQSGQWRKWPNGGQQVSAHGRSGVQVQTVRVGSCGLPLGEKARQVAETGESREGGSALVWTETPPPQYQKSPGHWPQMAGVFRSQSTFSEVKLKGILAESHSGTV